MDSFVDNLYTTPLYITKITEEEGLSTIQSEAVRAIEACEFSMREEWGPTHYLSSTTFVDNVIEKENMKIFSIIMHSHLQKYMDVIGFSMRPYMVTSWFSLFQPGQYGQVHNHGNADVAGCYYVETVGEGDLFFEDPRPAHDTSYVFSGRYTSGRRAYKPEVGKMFMFPGYLSHGIKTNTSNVDRVSLSFNIKFIDPRCELKTNF